MGWDDGRRWGWVNVRLRLRREARGVAREEGRLPDVVERAEEHHHTLQPCGRGEAGGGGLSCGAHEGVRGGRGGVNAEGEKEGVVAARRRLPRGWWAMAGGQGT
jgi:hypothetical protein